MSNSLKVGETVKLNSGGPLMTINEIGGDGKAFCIWFDNDEKRQGANFKIGTLTKNDGKLKVGVL